MENLNLRGIGYLRTKLTAKETRVRTRYRYYEMKNSTHDFNLTMPEKFKHFNECLGWCGKAVDALADRLVFREFRNDEFDMNGIFEMNNMSVLTDSAVLSALISSCCFVYISADDSGFPQLQVIDGGNATGIIDPISGMLSEGYAVLERDDHRIPMLEAYFIPGQTQYFPVGGEPYVIENDAPYPLLVPIVYRPDAVRPFGHSRISRACMDIMQGALRTLKRSEISAEFYSFPQKYILGTSQDDEPLDKWGATISTFLEVTKDEDGDRPIMGQFQQQSMTPFNEQMKMFASMFAGETGLTMDDLGFATENPSSAEAIKSQHENLRLTARKAQRDFNSCLLNVGYLASCVRDQWPYQRQQVYETEPVWEPIFEPDAAMISSIGDGVTKINNSVPGYFGPQNLRDLTGVGADNGSE